jgi:tetratricopeptide (TPR) repeat protein
VLLGIRVSDALAAAHAHGVVHRDLKPSNLFLVGHDVGRVKVLDFGIAQLSDATTMTKTGVVLGTPGYIAPEQARSGQDIDARADVFALGCVLFKCLTGTPVFSGDRLVIVLAKILFEEAQRVRRLQPNVPPALDALIAQMLSKDRNRRPPSCTAVAAALKALMTAAAGPSSDEAPLSSGVPSSRLTGSERRILSVVLLGPDHRTTDTGAPTRIEAESEMAGGVVGGTVAGADAALREVAEAHGGHLEWLADGSTLVLLSNLSRVATDQTAQAARCALALRAEARDRPMALTTGRVEVTGRLPAGDAIEQAERILSNFRPSEPAMLEPGWALPIAIDEVTAGLLDDRFDVVEAPWGFDLRGEREIGSGTRTLLGRPTSCVGREAELTALDALWTECVEEPVARAVLITAPAGIGKSRLAHEFIHRVKQRGGPGAIWIGRSDAMRAGSSFALIGQALRSAIGVLDGEPIETRKLRLKARVAEHVPERDQARVTAFLGEIVGTPFPNEESAKLEAARQDAELMGMELQRAAVDFLRAETLAHPVMVVLEDLHWGDLPTVWLLDEALRDLGDRPFLMLGLARPEVYKTFPGLWAERGLREVRLKGLTRRASERLVRQVLGDRVGKETVERLVEKAEGHAFYLEELIRAVAEGKGAALPETVLAMVAARLRGLDPEARRVLRAASVFGEVCWLGGVAELLGGAAEAAHVGEWLALLSAKEVLLHRPPGRFPSEPEFVFRHELLREGAYATLTDDDRALGHELAGEWLSQHGESDPIVLAEHFERGKDPARAASFFLRAAEQADRRWDLPAALRHAQRGIACGAAEDVRLALLGSLCVIYGWRNEPGSAIRYAKELLGVAVPGSALWARAATILFLPAPTPLSSGDLMATLQQLHDFEPPPEAVGSFDSLLGAAILFLDLTGHIDLTEALLLRKDLLVQSVSEGKLTVRGSFNITHSLRAALVKEDPWSGLECARAAKASLDAANHRRAEALAQLLHGMHAWYLGAFAEAERELRRITIVGDNIAAVSSYRLFCLSGVLIDRGSPAEARLVAERLIEDERAEGPSAHRAHGRWALANALLRLGDLDAAEHEAHEALELLPFLPLDHLAATATLAAIHLTQGRAAEALTAAEDAMRRYQTMRACGFFRGAVVHLVHAEALHAAGHEARARAAIAGARDHLLAIAAKVLDPVYRKSFLEDVPENARTFALARAWLGEGA